MSPHHNVKVALQSLSFLACRGLGETWGGGGGSASLSKLLLKFIGNNLLSWQPDFRHHVESNFDYFDMFSF